MKFIGKSVWEERYVSRYDTWEDVPSSRDHKNMVLGM